MQLSRLATATLLLAACAAPLPLPDGEHIGEPMPDREPIRLSVVSAEPTAYFKRTLLVEAEVTAVCIKAGCWMQVEDGGEPILVRWEGDCGGEYQFPSDIIGKTVLIQGSFYAKELTRDHGEHMQEEASGDLKIIENGYEMNASAVLILPAS